MIQIWLKKNTKHICTLFLLFLSSCSAMPQLFQEAEHVLDDEAVTIKISQEAFNRQTNIKAFVEIDNNNVQVK